MRPVTRASAPSRMSKALASSSTKPPAMRYPSATRVAAPAQTTSPSTVSTLGVSRNARSNGTDRRAARLTHSWNLAVNTCGNLRTGRALARRAVHLEDRVDHTAPVVELRLLHARSCHG